MVEVGGTMSRRQTLVEVVGCPVRVPKALRIAGTGGIKVEPMTGPGGNKVGIHSGGLLEVPGSQQRWVLQVSK